MSLSFSRSQIPREIPTKTIELAAVHSLRDRLFPRRKADVSESIENALASLRVYQTPLSDADKAMMMQGWNKALSFSSSFLEGLLIHWRLVCASSDSSDDDETDPMDQVERGRDPLAKCLTVRLPDAEEILMGMIDEAVRSLCPHTQIVQREAYRSVKDEMILEKAKGMLHLESLELQDYLDLFARLGVHPHYWVLFVTSYGWAVKTHVPYARDDDMDDLNRGHDSAVLRAIAQTICIPAIQTYHRLTNLYSHPMVNVIKVKWNSLNLDEQLTFSETFYRSLLTDYPELLDFFRKTDMDSLASHQRMALNLIFNQVMKFGDPCSQLRLILEHLGEVHRKMSIPTYTFPLVGASLMKTLLPFFDDAQKKDASTWIVTLYSEVMSIVYYPMLRHEKTVSKAKELYQQVKVELGWSESRYLNRIIEIEHEIWSTETYTQTTEEIEMGARLAWRNSSKCVGRIAWNTLKIRDCRHMEKPGDIFKDIRMHMLEATAGTNIQSLMTVYKPQSPYEPLGVRWWSSQVVRYAAYKNPLTGEVLGDPANLELTNYLIDNNRWVPPDEPTAFDVLPLVIKAPGRKRPYVRELPKDCVFEVALEHPYLPAITALGYRWSTVPAITTIRMNLGGIIYQNIPFNGWFASVEIVRNLMERYNAGPMIAQALGLDIEKDKMWRQEASVQLERAVLHSFQKHGFTIVDPITVGNSFCTHVQREREQFGRECPGQWSWIGGLLGPTNPTWHLAMRDFLVKPQYIYACDSMLLHTYLNDGGDVSVATTELSVDSSSDEPACLELPRVLIVYGSETGCAEAVAHRLKRELSALKPAFMGLNEAKGLSLVQKRKITHVLAICSTIGKGEFPSNAKEFFSTDIEACPDGTAYAVLALGSTVYSDFCRAGIRLDRKLKEAGLRPIATLAMADQVAGAEAAIDSWIRLIKKLIFPAHLQKQLELSAGSSALAPVVHRIKWQCSGDKVVDDSSSLSLCLSNTELLGECTERSTRQITFEAPGNYESGDHLAVQPVNSDDMVQRFVSCFEGELTKAALEGGANEGNALEWITKQPFEIEAKHGNDIEAAGVFFPTPTTLLHLLKAKVDLKLSGKDVATLLEIIAPILCESTGGVKCVELAHFLSLFREGEDTDAQTDSFLARYPTMVDFLEQHKDVLFNRTNRLNLVDVLVVLPRLQPRLYSISSSNIQSPDIITITVGVLNTETSKGVKIYGICSNYLASLVGGQDWAKITVHSSSFRLPKDPKAPCIMVGTMGIGTGLSSLIGFLQDRAIEKQNGSDVGLVNLFFGCRNEQDFIYKDMIRKMEEDGLLSLHLAMSRSPDIPKQYVRDKIKLLGEEAAKMLIDPNVHYYVCGDARMADDCTEAFVTVLRQYQNMSRIVALRHIDDMLLQGRWQTDVWGSVTNFEEAQKATRRCKHMAAKLWMENFKKSDDL